MDKVNTAQTIIERSRKFTVRVIGLCNTFSSNRAAWIVTDQIIRSGSSIGANIVEAQASSSKKEFKKFLEISLKSSNETLYWLSIAFDAKLAPLSSVKPLIDEATQLTKILGRSVITLKSALSKTL